MQRKLLCDCSSCPCGSSADWEASSCWAQDVFRSPLFTSCWGWPSVFSSPGETESVCSLTVFVSLFLISHCLSGYEDIVSTQLHVFLQLSQMTKLLFIFWSFAFYSMGQFWNTWNTWIHEKKNYNCDIMLFYVPTIFSIA